METTRSEVIVGLWCSLLEDADGAQLDRNCNIG
jgi:hypothetical protein